MNVPPQAPNSQQPGRPNAVVWIVVGVAIASACGCCLLTAVLFPVFEQAKMAAVRQGCISHVKELTTGMSLYAADYDGGLPPADVWMAGIGRYVREADVFSCPTVHLVDRGAYGYAMNRALSGAKQGKIKNDVSTPLLFDSTILTRNAASGPESMPRPGRHGGKNTVGYADGHVEAVQGG